MVSRQEQSREKKQCAVIILHIWLYKIVWRNKNQDCYIHIFTLHWSTAKTDAKRLRKSLFGVKLVSQFKFSIDFPPSENNPMDMLYDHARDVILNNLNIFQRHS